MKCRNIEKNFIHKHDVVGVFKLCCLLPVANIFWFVPLSFSIPGIIENLPPKKNTSFSLRILGYRG